MTAKFTMTFFHAVGFDRLQFDLIKGGKLDSFQAFGDHA
jgi:hypothetical protein